MKLSKISILIFTYILFPIISLEIYSQLRFYNNIGSKAYIANFIKDPNLNNPHIYGLHKANITTIETQSTLYDWKPSILNKSKEIIFRTDKYGTIEPSSLSKAVKTSGPYILFCGGSTTENSHVYENYRMADVFGRLNSISTVNAAKSAKNLKGCIETIGYLLMQSNKVPKKIIISNNVNSLWEFGRSKIKVESLKKISTKEYIKYIIPGIYTLSKETKKAIYINSLRNARKSRLSSYEKSLAKGCCHGAASMNKEKPFQVDWESKENKESYRKYIKQLIIELNTLLNKKDYPKKDIIIFMQPNSYGLKKIASKYDYRQLFHSFNGDTLSLQESREITSIYDNIYSNAMLKSGYKVLNLPDNYMRKQDFYDAAHLTKDGAKHIAIFLSNAINLKPL